MSIPGFFVGISVTGISGNVSSDFIRGFVERARITWINGLACGYVDDGGGMDVGRDGM